MKHVIATRIRKVKPEKPVNVPSTHYCISIVKRNQRIQFSLCFFVSLFLIIWGGGGGSFINELCIIMLLTI